MMGRGERLRRGRRKMEDWRWGWGSHWSVVMSWWNKVTRVPLCGIMGPSKRFLPLMDADETLIGSGAAEDRRWEIEDRR